VVHTGVYLGRGTEVGPYAVIEQDVAMGDRCRIASHVVIKRYTQMGDDNTVCEGAVLGGAPQDLKFSGGRSWLRIGHRNTIREGVTLHRAQQPDGKTRIGSDNYLMANVHVAHDCLLEDFIVLANNVALAGHVHIEDHAFLSGGVVVHQFSHIGRYAMIGGNSKVTQDALPFFLIDGNPARVRGLNLVGLRRGGFSAAEIRQLKGAQRILFDEGPSLESRIGELKAIDSVYVQQIVAFIGRSERGFCRADKSETRSRE
jgi:UDP-N-acetylglucosamine acyltransferase